MNRREFMKYSFMLAGMTFFPAISNATPALAKAQAQQTLVIKNNAFTFAEKLIKRKVTELIVIHHVGGTERNVTAADIHQWHLNNKWAGIGYHYVVHPDGMVESGRPMDMVGAHSLNYNENSVSICFVGDYETEKPTAKAIQAGEKVIAYICQEYGLRPTKDTLVGHRDLNQTLCPGTHLYNYLPQMRKNVMNLF